MLHSRDLAEMIFEGLDGAVARHVVRTVSGQDMALPTPDQGVVYLELPRLQLDEKATLRNVHVRT